MRTKNQKHPSFSARTKFLLFTLLIALVLILHYPMSFNEIGWDSFAIHILANSISEFGFAKWWLNPLSVFGMYPYSGISSALPFLLSGSSQLTGINGDINIFWISLLIGLLSIFTAYLMAGSIFDNDVYKFLVAVGYSTSQGILFYTTWTAGTRALFIILLPLFIYLLMKSTNSKKFFMFVVVFFVLLMSTHKMYYFLVPLILSFIFVHLIYKWTIFQTNLKQNSLFYLLFLFGILIAFMVPFFTRTFIQIGSRYELISQLGSTYIRYNGIALLFIAGGYIQILLSKFKSKGEFYLITSLVLLAPFVYILTYMKWFFMPFIFLLAGKGLWSLATSKKSHKMVPLVLVIIIVFSGYFQYIHFYKDGSSSERFLDKHTYLASTWSKEHVSYGHNFIGLYHATGERFFAISKRPTMTGIGAADLVYGFVNRSEINITYLPGVSLSTFFDSPYISTKRPKTIWFFENTFVYRSIEDESVKKTISHFNLSYLVENTNTGRSQFLSSINRQSGKYYDNGKIRIWDLKY